MVVALVLAMSLSTEPMVLGSHVRSSSAAIRSLCHEAEQQSALFASLVAELNQSDVVVYIEPSNRVPHGLIGAVNHDVVSSGGIRYVRVLVSPFGGSEHAIGVIAHELQHVVEIARAHEASDATSVEHLFQRIGFSRADRSYETVQAQTSERIVLAEIRSARALANSVASPAAGDTRSARAR